MAQEILVTGPQQNGDAQQIQARGGRSGETVVSELHAKYFETTSRKNCFIAQANVTAPVIYTTAAGTGGPLIWNGSSTVYCNILKIGFGVSTVSTVAAALGFTGGTGQTVAPTATTAIDGQTNCYFGGAASQATAYRVGTVLTAGAWFMPIGDLNTGALTTTPGNMRWIDVDGLCLFGPGAWWSVAASATASTTVTRIGVIWEEIPLAAVPA